MHCAPDEVIEMTHIESVAAAAVSAEREQCARIAEAMCNVCPPETAAILTAVAAAIRSRAEAQDE